MCNYDQGSDPVVKNKQLLCFYTLMVTILRPENLEDEITDCSLTPSKK